MILPFKVFPKNIYSKNSTHRHTQRSQTAYQCSGGWMLGDGIHSTYTIVQLKRKGCTDSHIKKFSFSNGFLGNRNISKHINS